MSIAGPLRVYMDEDVPTLLSQLLLHRGLDSQTAVGAGMLGRTDEEQLRLAAREGRVLVTHNRRDFERLAVEWWKRGESHGGIILAMRRADPHDLARHVLPVLLRVDQATWRDLVMFA